MKIRKSPNVPFLSVVSFLESLREGVGLGIGATIARRLSFFTTASLRFHVSGTASVDVDGQGTC